MGLLTFSVKFFQIFHISIVKGICFEGFACFRDSVISDGFAADYPDGSNSSEYLVQPTTYLPENFTYAQNLPCPERLPSMSKYMVANIRSVV